MLLFLFIFFLFLVLLVFVLVLLRQTREEDPKVWQGPTTLCRLGWRPVILRDVQLYRARAASRFHSFDEGRLVMDQVVLHVHPQRKGASRVAALGIWKARRMAGMVVEAPQQLLKTFVRDEVIRQAQLPQRLRAVPKVGRQCGHCLVSQTIACYHESSHCHTKLRHLLEKLGCSRVLQGNATDIQHLETTMCPSRCILRCALPNLCKQGVNAHRFPRLSALRDVWP